MGTKLFVRNFGDQVDLSDLESLFGTVGTVEKVDFQQESFKGVERMVAYVQMSSREEAEDSIARFHGHKIDGHHMIVTEDKPHTPDPEFHAKRRALMDQKKKTAAIRSERSKIQTPRSFKNIKVAPTQVAQGE